MAHSDGFPFSSIYSATETCHGLAVCPLCCNEDPYRLRCRLCWGLGYVGRAMRNDYKLGRVRP
jgi:hypothetical protein